MARRCTTVPGYGACCAAYARGVQGGQPFPLQVNGRTRCAVCTPVMKRNGQAGSHFKWAKAGSCGLGSGGCPSNPLAAQGQQNALQLR